MRHLVPSKNLAGSDRVLSFIARGISPKTYLNLVDQYRPCYRADQVAPLDRPLTRDEFHAALALEAEQGFTRLDCS